jgi:sulfur-carrier protein
MKLHIKYFASVREALNQDSQDFESAAPTVQALLNELMASSVVHAAALAFFPPVTGG